MTGPNIFSGMCRDTNRCLNSAKILVSNIIKHKGIDWMIAALVDSSNGYYTPYTAYLQLKRMLEFDGIPAYNEYNTSCHGGCILHEMKYAVRVFARCGQEDADRLIKICQRLKDADGWMFNTTLSMMLPTTL